MKDSTDIDVSDQLGWTKHYVFHSQEEKLPDVMLSFDKSGMTSRQSACMMYGNEEEYPQTCVLKAETQVNRTTTLAFCEYRLI